MKATTTESCPDKDRISQSAVLRPEVIWETEDRHSRKIDGIARDRAKYEKAKRKKYKLRGFTGHFDDLAGDERFDAMCEKARRNRVGAGTEGVSADIMGFLRSENLAPQPLRPLPWQHKVVTSHKTMVRQTPVLDLKAVVARFKRTGEIPNCTVEEVRALTVEGVDGNAVRRMIQAMLLKSGLEPDPGPTLSIKKRGKCPIGDFSGTLLWGIRGHRRAITDYADSSTPLVYCHNCRYLFHATNVVTTTGSAFSRHDKVHLSQFEVPSSWEDAINMGLGDEVGITVLNSSSGGASQSPSNTPSELSCSHSSNVHATVASLVPGAKADASYNVPAPAPDNDDSVIAIYNKFGVMLTPPRPPLPPNCKSNPSRETLGALKTSPVRVSSGPLCNSIPLPLSPIVTNEQPIKKHKNVHMLLGETVKLVPPPILPPPAQFGPALPDPEFPPPLPPPRAVDDALDGVRLTPAEISDLAASVAGCPNWLAWVISTNVEFMRSVYSTERRILQNRSVTQCNKDAVVCRVSLSPPVLIMWVTWINAMLFTAMAIAFGASSLAHATARLGLLLAGFFLFLSALLPYGWRKYKRQAIMFWPHLASCALVEFDRGVDELTLRSTVRQKLRRLAMAPIRDRVHLDIIEGTEEVVMLLARRGPNFTRAVRW